MKQRILLGFLALTLIGAGCFSSSKEASDTTYDASPDWWLSFDLPGGWVMVRHYEEDAPIDLGIPIGPSLTDIVLQSTDKNIWISADRSPSEDELLEIGGEDQIVYDDYTYIRALHLGSRNLIPEEAEDIGDGFWRLMLCEASSECDANDGSNYEYYFETEEEKYKFYIDQSNQERSVAEGVILSAVEEVQ